MKPIEIKAVSGGYTVHVSGTPVVAGARGGLDFDRAAAGLKVAKTMKNQPPASREAVVMTEEQAKGIAHTIGRYVLKMGDMTFSYTKAPAGFWEE